LLEVNVVCFPRTCVSNEVKPLPIFTPFIMALLEFIEPLAKMLPATSNASVAAVSAPILNPLSIMLCKVVVFILKSSFLRYKHIYLYSYYTK